MKAIDELIPRGIDNPNPGATPDELREEIAERMLDLNKLPVPGWLTTPKDYDPSEYNRLHLEISNLQFELDNETIWKPHADSVRKADAESRRRKAEWTRKTNAWRRQKSLLNAAKERRKKKPEHKVNAVADHIISNGKTTLKKRRVIDIINVLWEDE